MIMSVALIAIGILIVVIALLFAAFAISAIRDIVRRL